MNSIEEFYDDFIQQVYTSADVGEDFKESQFFDKAIEYIIDEGSVEDYTYLPYKKIGMKIDGFEFIEDREILNLFICDFEDDYELKTLTNSDIELNIKRLIKFFNQSLEKKFYEDLEETSPGYAISYFLYQNQDRFKTINIILISNKLLSKSVKKLPVEQIKNYKVLYDIWEMKRFFDIDTSKNKNESLVINFEEDFDALIPSLPAHISSSPYRSYLCVVNGKVLAGLYEKYGAKLLESNVRSFLQFRAKINKGIRKTINDNPSMFFAYNNGLTATAEDIEITDNNQIKSLKNFQIVNGGQTTASLFNTMKMDKVDLSDIFVQMKLTIIDDENVNEVVPNISRFANTQNKVSDADFFSNDIYHIRMEEKSRRIWAPAQEGQLNKTKWFYERARGQYLEVQSKLTDAKKREFKEINPKNQLFSKTDLAKYLMVWEEKPHIVSQGAQKNFIAFGNIIVPMWNKNDKEFNDIYYMHAIAKIIIFKACDKIVFKEPWYGGYKANIVAYTLSTISYLLSKEHLSIDYTNIWKNQKIELYFENEIKNISKYINFYILKGYENITNISEWCKKELCWTKLKEILNNTDDLNLSEEFKNHMISRQQLNYENKEAKKEQKIDNEVQLLKKLFHVSTDKWNEIINWGKEKRMLIETEIKLIQKIRDVNITGKVPTDREQKRIVQIINKLLDEGMSSIDF